MKKLIYGFIVFISIFIFYMDYNVRSGMEYDNINNLQDLIAKNEGKDILQLEFNVENPKFYDIFFKYAYSQEQTIAVARSNQDTDLSIYQNYYIYSCEPSKTFSTLYLENDKYIDFSKQTKEYYTSILDDKSINHIDYLNKNYHKDYYHKITIYQLEQLLNDKSENQLMYAYIYTDDIMKTIHDVENSQLAPYLSEGWKDNQYEPVEETEYDNELMLKLLFISAVTVLILTICEMIKNKKEIMIRKMYGMSSTYILNKMFLPQFVISLLLYIITNVLMFSFLIGHIRSTTHLLIESQVQYFLLFFILNLVLYSIIYLFIRFTRNINHVKQDGTLKYVAYLNYCLKIIVIIVIMGPIISFVELGMREVKSATFLLTNKDILRNQLFISGIRDVDGKDMMTSIKEIKEYFKSKGAIYQDFFQDEVSEEMDTHDDTMNMKPYLIVNKEYLKMYNLQNENGNLIDLETLQDNTLLVPEKYKNEDFTSYCDTINCPIVMIENGNTYINRDPVTALDNNFNKKDAIILVKDLTDSSSKWAYPFMLLKEEPQQISVVLSELKEKGLLDAVDIENTSSRYDLVFQQIKDNCIYLISLLIVYTIVILTFLYQTIFMYFISNKEEFALRYLFGNNFVERHGKMVIINATAYIIPLLIGTYIFNIDITKIIIFIAIAILFEIISSLVLVKKFEKRNITGILKGE